MHSLCSRLYSIEIKFYLKNEKNRLLRLRRFKHKSVKVGVFRRGGSLSAQILDGRGHRPPTTVSVGVIGVSCGMKISAVPCLVLSQSTHATDGQTDGQNYAVTTPKTALE